MTATLTALGCAVVLVTTAYTVGWCVGAHRFARALAVIVVGLALGAALGAHYLDVLDGVDPAGIFITSVAALATPVVAWFGWDVGREHRADEQRRHWVRSCALVLVLACGATTLVQTTSVKPAEAVTAPAGFAAQTSSGSLRTWIWRGPHCGTFPFLSFEYVIFNQTFGCSIGFTTAGTNLMAGAFWSYFQQLLGVSNAMWAFLITVNVQVLQAGAQWCRAQGLTLWARWRTDAAWYVTLWGIIPEMSCWYPVSP